VSNTNVAEYRALAGRHLSEVGAREVGSDRLLVEAETSQSRNPHRRRRPDDG